MKSSKDKAISVIYDLMEQNQELYKTLQSEKSTQYLLKEQDRKDWYDQGFEDGVAHEVESRAWKV